MLSSTALRIAVSQIATLRWDLGEELCHYREHGFEAISLWRQKISDVSLFEARELLGTSGVRVSSLQWPGGFTGSEGHTFRESLEDACEAIDAAEQLHCPLIVLHPGGRAGHTLSHARRLIRLAMKELAPIAESAGVMLAIKPAKDEASFLTTLIESLDVVNGSGSTNVGLAVDLWSFSEELLSLDNKMPVIERMKIVSVADRICNVSLGHERLPPGTGDLPLSHLLYLLLESGYSGDIEFDPIGETVAEMGYEELLASVRRYVDQLQSDMNVIETDRLKNELPAPLAKAFFR